MIMASIETEENCDGDGDGDNNTISHRNACTVEKLKQKATDKSVEMGEDVHVNDDGVGDNNAISSYDAIAMTGAYDDDATDTGTIGIDSRKPTMPNDDDTAVARADDDARTMQNKAATIKSKKYDVKSFIFPDFLKSSPGLDKEIVKFFDGLYSKGFQRPGSCGQKTVVAIEAPYSTNPQATVDRQGYMRQNFSTDNETKQTNNEATVFRHSYGTGSGLITHGIPKW